MPTNTATVKKTDEQLERRVFKPCNIGSLFVADHHECIHDRRHYAAEEAKAVSTPFKRVFIYKEDSAQHTDETYDFSPGQSFFKQEW